METITLDYINSLIQGARTLGLDKIKAFLANELSKHITHSSIVWATRQNKFNLLNIEQSFTAGYQQGQLSDYERYGQDDIFLDYLLSHPGEAVRLNDIFDPDKHAKLTIFTHYTPKYQINDCLGYYYHSDTGRFTHLLSLHINQHDTLFSKSDQKLLASLFPLLCQIIDLILCQYQEKHWVFDSSGKSADGQLEAITSLMGQKEFQVNMGDFYVIPKECFKPDLLALSTSEQSVAEMLLRGHSNKQIARDLSKSPSTVAKQLTSIFNKLNVKNRSELINRLRKQT